MSRNKFKIEKAKVTIEYISEDGIKTIASVEDIDVNCEIFIYRAEYNDGGFPGEDPIMIAEISSNKWSWK